MPTQLKTVYYVYGCVCVSTSWTTYISKLLQSEKFRNACARFYIL